MTLRTHYDNLKVSRDAPSEVIRAAYKSLAQKYHPDRNHGDERAARVMSLINEAYEVLSDPARRSQHDEWITAQESRPEPSYTPQPQPQPQRSVRHRSLLAVALTPITYAVRFSFHFILELTKRAAGIGFVLLCIYGASNLFSSKSPSPPPPTSVVAPANTYSPAMVPNQATASKPAARPQCVAMPVSPKGKPWPTMAQPISKFRTKGHSSITLDNTGGGSNIYAKVTISGTKTDVKDGYVPSGQSLELKDLPAGSYVIKYKNVATGCSSVSKEFDLDEVVSQTGINYTHVDVTIYTVADGNMRFDRLSDADF